MESKNINFIVLAFVFLILGSVLIGQIATNTNARTSKTNVVDEAIDIGSSVVGGQVNESLSNFTVTNIPSSWKVQDCTLTALAYGNSTGNYVLNTDYETFSFGTDGIIHVLNTTTTENGGNDTLADYAYCADDYLNSGWGRTVLNLVAGFFALALLGVALWLFYSVFKETGILGR